MYYILSYNDDDVSLTIISKIDSKFQLRHHFLRDDLLHWKNRKAIRFYSSWMNIPANFVHFKNKNYFVNASKNSMYGFQNCFKKISWCLKILIMKMSYWKVTGLKRVTLCILCPMLKCTAVYDQLTSFLVCNEIFKTLFPFMHFSF